MMTREQWLATRKTGIPASDAAAILGLSPWKSPLDVWLEKTGRATIQEIAPEREDLFFLGHQLEPAIAAMYSRKTGRELLQVQENRGLLRHQKHPIVIGTPDRLVVGERRGVELKSEVAFMDRFGDPGTDDVPMYYAVQCAQYMAITDFDAWDIALLHGGAKFAIYTLERNRDMERDLVEFIVEWWHRHVVANVAPEIDGSESATRYLANEFRKNVRPLEKATDAEEDLAIELGKLRENLAIAEGIKSLFENRIRKAIGDREGFFGSFGRVTWKKSKDSTIVDYETAFEELADHARTVLAPTMDPNLLAEAISTILTNNTHTKEGSRRLLYTPAKG